VVQGADFMFQCVKILLESPQSGPYKIHSSNPLSDFEMIQQELETFLKDCLGGNHRILFHLDISTSTIANKGRANVVATYTDVPNLPRRESSELCRLPLRLPILDINKVMKAVPELQFDHACTTRIHSRMLATLKFRLAMKIRDLGITSVLHCRL
jgi:hypothetical protein